MKKYIIIFLILFIFFSITFVEAPIKVNQVKDFKAKYGDKWEVEWNKKTEMPHRIYGYNIDSKNLKSKLGIKSLSDNTQFAIENFISENEDLLKIRLSDLKLKKSEYDKPLWKEHNEGVWYVFYEQYHKNIPVYKSSIGFVIINEKIVLIDSNYYPDINILTIPKLSKNDALKIVKEELGLNDIETENVSLVIFPEDAEKNIIYHLAWKVELPLIENPLSKFVFFIDAHNGEIVYKYNNIVFGDATGKVTGMVYLNDPTQSQVEVNFSSENITAKQSGLIVGYSVTNQTGYYNITGLAGTVNITAELKGPWVNVNNADQTDASHTYQLTTPGTHSWNWNESDTSYYDEESNVFYHVNVVHDYFTKGDPFDITDMNYQVIATAQYGSGSCNAFYSGGNIFFYGPGGGCNSTALAADIIYHEYTHSVVDKIYTYFPYSGQTGAMNEGYADYFAATITNNSLIGEGVFPSPIRNLNNTVQYPSSWTEVHSDSRSFSGAMWDLRTLIGQSLADSLIIRAMKAQPHSFSEFLDNLLIMDDDNGNLLDGTPNKNEICQAFYLNHGIKSANCNASLINYKVSQVSYSWLDAVTNGQKVNASESTDGVEGMADDDLTIAIDIGFNFTFYNKTYDKIYIGSNGIVAFESFTVNEFTLYPIPDFSAPNKLIAVCMEDLNPGTTYSGDGDVYYWKDTANNRFIIEWYQVHKFNTIYDETFEVILYKNGKIVMQYQSLVNNSLDCVTGIENEDGTLGKTYINSSLIDNLEPIGIEFYPLTAPPIITTESPLNKTYTVTHIDFNITVNKPLTNASFSVDNLQNNTMINDSLYHYYNTTYPNLAEGHHNVTFYANDTEGNLNSTVVWFLVDKPPYWLNNSTNLVTTYSPTNLSFFNITWNDTKAVSSVCIQGNWSEEDRNYTMYNVSNIYQYNITLPAGDFYWLSYANDSADNWNSTPSWIFNVGKASMPIHLYINGTEQNQNYTYGVTTNVSGIKDFAEGDLTLYRNSSNVTNPEITILAAGYYNYTLIFNGTQNYTENSTSLFLTIEKAISNLTLLLNGTDGNFSINESQIVNITVYLEPNDNVSVYIDNNLYTYNITPLTNLSTFHTPGTYNITAYYNENQNYTGNYSTHWLQVNDTTSPNITANIFPPLILLGENITISANIIDNLNISLVWFNITNSSGEIYNETIGNTSGFYNVSYNTTNLTTGTYNVTIFANDTTDNLNYTLAGSFNISQPINITINILDNQNNLTNISKIEIVYKDTNITRNSSLENVTGFNSTLPAGYWNIKLYSEKLNLTIQDVNATNNTAGNIKIDENVSEENLTLPSNVRIFAETIAAETSFNFTNASLTISYNESVFVNESRINVFACHNWSMPARNCTGTWENATINSSINTTANLVTLNTTNLSAFSVAEGYKCGDGIIDSGEECDGSNLGGYTCSSFGYTGGSLSCTASCTFDKSACTSTPPSGPPGPAIVIQKKEIGMIDYPAEVAVRQNESKTFSITLNNSGEINLTGVNVSVKSDCENCKISIMPNNVTLKTNEAKKFDVLVSVSENQTIGRYILNITTTAIESVSNKTEISLVIKEKQICSLNVKQCFDNNLKKCNSEGTNWTSIETCLYGCNTTTLTCNSKPRICIENETKCFDNNLKKCLSNKWILIENCTYKCEAGKCIEKIVTPINYSWIWIIIIIILIIGGIYYWRFKKGKELSWEELEEKWKRKS